MDCFGVRVRPPALAGLTALALVLAGCSHQAQQTRLQSADEPEPDRYGVRTVGEITTVSNAAPTPVGGVGLVVDLDGNGGDTPPDDYRTLLEKDLLSLGVKKVKEVLNDPDNAMVLVSAEVPGGAQQGDPIDLEVRLPPRSRATSLRGGHLLKCQLYTYDSTTNLSPGSDGPKRMLLGHPIASAEGPVLVGFGGGDEAAGEKVGHVWGGGKCRIDAPLALLLNPGSQVASISDQAARRINECLQVSRGPASVAVAVAKSHQAIALKVPAQYRLNLPRFLRVVRLVPRNDFADGGRAYRQRLADDLLDPAKTVAAALRLEALGAGSVATLREAMQTSDNDLVRFCAAEALAYLGSAEAGEALAAAAEKKPLFRAFALTALASLDENISRLKLEELMTGPFDADLRYGAFRALRALEEGHPAVQGELLNEAFRLHRVAPNSTPLVHVTGSSRAEVVVFGVEPKFKVPFWISAGEFQVTATPEDDRCTIARIPVHGSEPTRLQCPLQVEAVLRTLARMGAAYPEVVEVLQQADSTRSLTCPLARDALPQAVSVFDLAELGGAKVDAEPPDLGATPTLYEAGRKTKN